VLGTVRADCQQFVDDRNRASGESTRPGNCCWSGRLGLTPSERTAALILDEEGFDSIDPAHPLAGGVVRVDVCLGETGIRAAPKARPTGP
jgi:hypothetical protein